MGVRIKNKKKFLLRLFTFILILINFNWAISIRQQEDSAVYKTLASEIKHKVLITDTNGSIEFSESRYFKKYVIKCKSNVTELNWVQTDDMFMILLNKNEISNLGTRISKGAESPSIDYEEQEKSYIIKIKKDFISNNFLYIDRNDKKKIVIFTTKKENPFHHVVVIDPGHGGSDKGANYGDLYEKNITLKLANLTAEELKFNGFKVIQTREDDRKLELKEIGNIVNSAFADVFLSIHVNDNKLSKYKGITSYYYAPEGYQKEERIKFAKSLQAAVVRDDNWQDRGSTSDNLAVLRYSKIPCALLECGFLSNMEDRMKLLNDDMLKNLAANITNGIVNYFSAE